MYPVTGSSICASHGNRCGRWKYRSSGKISCTITMWNSAPTRPRCRTRARRSSAESMESCYGVRDDAWRDGSNVIRAHRAQSARPAVGSAMALTGATATREYQVKAVFLFNFTQFVEWPAGAFARVNTPLVIGVLGDDPFGAYLDETVRGETANGRPLVVVRYRRVQEIGDCQV